MHGAFPGIGTLVNVAAVVLGSLAGLVIGHRIPDRTRNVVTDCLGLVTLLMAGLSAIEVTNPDLTSALPTGSAILVVLGSLLIGSIAGSLLGIERRLESLAGVVQRRLGGQTTAGNPLGDDAALPVGSPPEGGSGRGAASARERFIEGWLTTSLLFCVGPLTILGSISDGMGRGIDQLVLKSALDCFASLAFAASFGIGVLFSAVSVLVVQGLLTLAGVVLGTLLPAAHVAALTCVGGLLLVGISFRLLRLRDVPVGDMLPALVVTPLLVQAVAILR